MDTHRGACESPSRAGPMRRMINGACLMLMFVPCALVAQSVLRGVVFDSLRSLRPLAGAEVVVIGSSRRTVTDDRGEFAFELAEESGQLSLAFSTPWLDSIGIEFVRRDLVLGSRPVETLTLV